MTNAAGVDEQAWLDAWNSQRAAPIIEIADAEVEVHAVTLGIEGRHYRGHEGLREWMREIAERFKARAEAESLSVLDDDAVLVCGKLFVTDEFGGEEEQRFALVCHLRGGKASWIGTFFSPSDARAAHAAGLTGPQSR